MSVVLRLALVQLYQLFSWPYHAHATGEEREDLTVSGADEPFWSSTRTNFNPVKPSIHQHCRMSTFSPECKYTYGICAAPQGTTDPIDLPTIWKDLRRARLHQKHSTTPLEKPQLHHTQLMPRSVAPHTYWYNPVKCAVAGRIYSGDRAKRSAHSRHCQKRCGWPNLVFTPL